MIPIERPEELRSTTYKLRVPTGPEAFYITISDFTDDLGRVRPYELFINTKNMQDLELITCMTRLISAIFRNCECPCVAIDELHAVYNPEGGFFLDGKHQPSVTSAIGDIIKKHVDKLNNKNSTEVPNADKKEKLQKELKDMSKEEKRNTFKNAVICKQCNAKAYIKQQNCGVCYECGYSDCG